MESEVEILTTKTGKPLLVVDGYQHRLNRTNNYTTTWVCLKEKLLKCKGRTKTTNQYKVLSKTEHTCMPNVAEIEVKKKIQMCKKRVREEISVPVYQIFREEMAEIYSKGYEFVTKTPLYHNVKTALCAERRKVLRAGQNTKDSEDYKKKMESKDPPLAAPASKSGTPQNKKQETLYADSNRVPTDTAKLCENDEFEMSGRRIVNINYFFQQLMQLNKHGPPGCSLNNMNIVSETRTGLASEIKFKCSKCNFEKRVWTEDVSSQLPLNLNTAAVTGTIGIRNGLSAMEDFLDVLNVPSVSINTTYAKKRDDKVPSASPQTEMETAVDTVKQLSTKQEEADTEGFTIVVKGTWARKTPGTSQSRASSEKPPEVVFDSKPEIEFMDRELSPLITTVSPSVVRLNPRTEATSELILPDLSEPGPSSRMEMDSSMMEQDAHMAMTCDNYPVHMSEHDSFSKIKEEPIDIDTYKPATDEQGIEQFSNESAPTSNQEDSLFHPPVLIKEEPVYFEEES